MIPKLLHRIVLPPLEDRGQTHDFGVRLAALHPTWQIRTWTHWSQIADSEVGSAYERVRTPAGVADLMRLEILLRHGGVYLDADCEPVRPLDPLLARSCFFGTEDGEHISTGVIGAEPDHPALRALLRAVLDEDRLRLDLPPNVATGPVFTTQVLSGRDDLEVLPPELFYPESWWQAQQAERATAREASTAFTYVVHRWDGSWVPAPPPEPPPAPPPPLPARVKGSLRGQLRRVARAAQPETEQAPSPPAVSHDVGEDRALVRLPCGRPLLVVKSDLSLTPDLLTTGVYDRPYWEFLGGHLRPGDRVVDVGANIGLMTVRMASLVGRQGRVQAYEPQADVAQVLRDNIEMNWLAERVVLRSAAVGDAPGTMALHGDERFLGSTRATAELGTGPEVRACRLDEELPHDLPLALVKVDVEGGEAAVLRGMSGLLDAGCVRVLDLEVVRRPGPEWLDLLDQMRALVDDRGAIVSLLDDAGRQVATRLDDVIGAAGQLPHVLFTFPAAS